METKSLPVSATVADTHIITMGQRSLFFFFFFFDLKKNPFKLQYLHFKHRKWDCARKKQNKVTLMKEVNKRF
jgi:hypothetical protein